MAKKETNKQTKKRATPIKNSPCHIFEFVLVLLIKNQLKTHLKQRYKHCRQHYNIRSVERKSK